MIAVYCRVSTEAQDDNFSIKEQRTQGENFANGLNEDFQIYEDVYTGKTINRPALQVLIEDIRNRRINKIWVKEFSRLSREVVVSHTLKDLFNEYDVEIYTDNDLREVKTPDQFLRFSIDAMMSDYERQRIIERLQRGANRKRRDGGKWCSNPAYGYEAYRNEKGERKIRLNENEVENVLYIFEQFSSKKMSIKQLSKELNDRLIPFRNSKKWYWSDLNRLLKQTLYAGFYVFEDKEVKSIVYPKIIERETFDISQAILKERNTKNSTRYNNHLSSGILKCYYCNQSVIFHNKKYTKVNGDPHYKPQYKINHSKDCERNLVGRKTQNFRPAEKLDEWLTYQFREFASDVDSLYNYFLLQEKENSNKKDRVNMDIIRLEKQKKEINKKKKKTYDLMLKIDDTDLSDAYVKLSEEEKTISAKIENLRKSLILDENKLFDILQTLKGDLINEFESHTDTYPKRQIFLRMVETGYIKDRTIYIKWITGKEVTVEIDEVDKWWKLREDKNSFHTEVMDRLNSLPEQEQKKADSELRKYLIEKIKKHKIAETTDLIGRVENIEEDISEGTR